MATETVASPSIGRLIWEQFRYQNKVFWRTPVSAFFTLAFPLMLLFLFVAIFGNDEIEGLGITSAQFSAPGLAVLGAVSAAYTGLAIGTAISRDNGLLKRVRGTPLPPWGYIAGRVTSATYQAGLAVLLMMGAGILFFGVTANPRTLPAAVLTFLVGVGCFAALGMLVAALAPSGESTPAITNASLLPLAFISDIFFPISDPPTWMAIASNIFPLRHFAVPFRDAFDPTRTGLGSNWTSLGVMLLWGLAAFMIAQRRFRWEPRHG